MFLGFSLNHYKWDTVQFRCIYNPLRMSFKTSSNKSHFGQAISQSNYLSYFLSIKYIVFGVVPRFSHMLLMFI